MTNNTKYEFYADTPKNTLYLDVYIKSTDYPLENFEIHASSPGGRLLYDTESNDGRYKTSDEFYDDLSFTPEDIAKACLCGVTTKKIQTK